MENAQKDQTTRLGNILMRHGVLNMVQLHEASCKQFNTEKRFGEVLQELGLATSSQINAALMDQQYRRTGNIES